MAKKDVEIGIKRKDPKDQLKGISRTHKEIDSDTQSAAGNSSGPSSGGAKGAPSATHRVSLVMAILVLVSLVAISGMWLRQQSQKTANEQSGSATTGNQASSPVVSVDMLLDEAAQAMAAGNVDEIKEAYHLGDVDAQSALEFLKRLKMPNRTGLHLEWVGNEYGAKNYEGVVVKWWSEGKLKQRLCPMLPDETGTWKIDFEAFANTCDPEWPHLTKGAADQGRVRVVFKRDNYYNARYSEDKWICYRLRWIDSEVAIFGYTRKGSVQDDALKALTDDYLQVLVVRSETFEPTLRAILEIERKEGAMPNQYEIVRVLASDWVEEEEPFDQQFMKDAGQ